MNTLKDTKLSMLDLVAVREGRSVADSLAVALRTAQHAETLGFARYWVAEHHNMPRPRTRRSGVTIGDAITTPSVRQPTG